MRTRPGSPNPAPGQASPSVTFAHNQINCARFFCDLRRVLDVSSHQAAGHLVARAETIEALERGDITRLPPWPETARVVMAYAAWAGIDGRPVLAAIAEMMREIDAHGQPHLQLAPPRQAAHRGPQRLGPQRLHVERLPVERIRRAGTAIAHGAVQLPRQALAQVRRRPDRAFYAVSFPLVLIVVAMNTSFLAAPLSAVAEPAVHAVKGVKSYFQERFAPVREGFRWIEVDDPRQRRGDKLPVEPR